MWARCEWPWAHRGRVRARRGVGCRGKREFCLHAGREAAHDLHNNKDQLVASKWETGTPWRDVPAGSRGKRPGQTSSLLDGVYWRALSSIRQGVGDLHRITVSWRVKSRLCEEFSPADLHPQHTRGGGPFTGATPESWMTVQGKSKKVRGNLLKE